MKTGMIYIIKNKVNNKVYIGQTTDSLHRRWGRHKSDRKNIAKYKKHKLYVDMRKYGVDNFYIEELELNIKVDKLNERESFWIQKFDSVEKGYNFFKGAVGILDVESFTKDYMSGMLLKNICEKYEVDLVTIRRLRNKLNLPIRLEKKPSGSTEYNREEFINDYTSGMKLQDMAEKYEVDVKTISKRRNSLSLEKRKLK